MIIGIITIVLFGGAVLLSSAAADRNNEGVEIVPHITGNPDAAVTLVEYSDFECPACSQFQPVLEQVLEQYGDQLSFEYRNFPLYLADPRMHRHSVVAAMAAEAAGQQGKFFEYHNLLFANQSEWAAATNPSTFFLQYADELGLDLPTFKRHVNSSMLMDRIKSDFASGIERQISGTPTLFLNGEMMQFETFQEFIEQIAFAIDPNALGSTTGSTTQTGTGVRFGL